MPDQGRALSLWFRDQHWTAFETLTFSREQSCSSAMKHYRRHHEALETDHNLATRAFVVVEEGKRFGRVHLHALSEQLVSDLWDGDASRARIKQLWEKKHGWATIEGFDPEKGGIAYCTKYVVKAGRSERFEYDFVGDWSGWATGTGSTTTPKAGD